MLVQKTGSFTQNTLPQVENCQVGRVDLLFHPTHSRLRGLHINNKATQLLYVLFIRPNVVILANLSSLG